MPHAGDLVLARVVKIGQHPRIELPDGRRSHLYIGDEVIVCYGARYAPDQFESHVPKEMGPCDLVAAGGLASRLGNKMRDAARLARRHRVRLASDLNERIALMPVVQAFSQVSRERRRVARRGRTLRNAMIARARIVGSLRGVSELITGLAVVAILAVGGLEVSNGRTSAGSLLAAMAILGMLTPALRDLSRSLEYWHTYKISVGRIEAFLATPILDNTEQLDLVELSAGPGTIEFHAVHADTRLQASGHDFEQCVNQGQMIEHVLKFFRLGTLASLPQKNIAAPMDGQQPTHHVVVIKQDVA